MVKVRGEPGPASPFRERAAPLEETKRKGCGSRRDRAGRGMGEHTQVPNLKLKVTQSSGILHEKGVFLGVHISALTVSALAVSQLWPRKGLAVPHLVRDTAHLGQSRQRVAQKQSN